MRAIQCALLPLALLLVGCGSSGGTDDEDAEAAERYDRAADDAERAAEEAVDETGTRPSDFEVADDFEVKGGETYPQYDDRRDSYGGAYGSFAGDECTEDCSGHEAGYRWAEDKGIDDPDDCGGKSWSFEEGCRAFASGEEE